MKATSSDMNGEKHRGQNRVAGFTLAPSPQVIAKQQQTTHPGQFRQEMKKRQNSE